MYKILKVDITFILVKPKVPENIGASARALKTMGFSKLCLVDPCDHKSVKAYQLAHGSHEILDSAEVHESLQAAVNDHDLVIGTTTRKRISRSEYINISDLKSFLHSREDEHRNIALVFGSEESGLSNSEIELCDLVSTISMAEAYPSLNLSQAVMLYAFTLAEIVNEEKKNISAPDGPGSLKSLKTKIDHLLSDTDIENNKALKGRIMERISLASDKDIRLMHSVLNTLFKKYVKDK